MMKVTKISEKKTLLHTGNTLQQQLDYYLRNSTCREKQKQHTVPCSVKLKLVR